MVDSFLITCEHGGNEIPLSFGYLFQTDEDRVSLDSHRGFDCGALNLAMEFAQKLAAPLVTSTVSRLLVDLNRSLGNPRVFSRATRDAPAAVRENIVETYYLPYRLNSENLIRQAVARKQRVVHISCHSFTPELDGKVRNADIGLLYDPTRKAETAFCTEWKASLNAHASNLRVRRNYPYAGKNDGFTTYLRRCFSPDQYLGIELEVNQKHVMPGNPHWTEVRSILVESLPIAFGEI